MKNTYKVMLSLMLALALIGPVAGAEGAALPAETQARLMEQYGLDAPALPLWDWSSVDVGGSGITGGMLFVCRLMLNPLGFLLQEMLYIL
ncbi:hypothetical protein MKX42_15880 [Paenibacillus sp. FSL R7-0204]|uniref:hypothetical protein n=1 Tax=Paenibacillus sp. FSL R7-0204 TaxID=2921675 RepID=UPI0030F64D32